MELLPTDPYRIPGSLGLVEASLIPEFCRREQTHAHMIVSLLLCSRRTINDAITRGQDASTTSQMRHVCNE